MPDTSLIGVTLAGRFKITGVIGEGGMATVYRGQVEGGTEVAVKIMNTELAKESRFVRRFRREAKAAAMLKHPNTVQILEFGVDQGHVFLAMELLQGFDLAMLLHRERRIPEARALQIGIQVCRALSAAHQQGIIHRDLKPDNIMLVRLPPGMSPPVPGMAPTDLVKVLDFGIAKILDDDGSGGGDPRAEPITQEKSMLTRVGTIVGTPAYMAPEQGRAEPVDARTDIYAVGVLLYELITGRVPFTGETPMQVVMRHVNEPPRPPGDFVAVHPDVQRIIMRALAKWPSERQQNAEELAFELLSTLPALGVEMPPSIREDEDSVKRTLVIEQPAVPAAPRPAAGAPPRPVAAAATPIHPTDASAPAFPTLNIEVPDDIFPGAPTAGAASFAAPSTDPAPTQRIDIPKPLPAAGKPAPAVPVVRPGQDRVSSLDQTMQSAIEDDEEARTMVKSPTEADKARVSLHESAMAAALGAGLPKVDAPESVEPTLIAATDPGKVEAPRAPAAHVSPAPGAGPTDGGGTIDPRALAATLKVSPQEVAKAVAEATAGAKASPSPPPSPEPARSPVPEADRPAAPVRRPTSELIPVTLQEEGDAASPPEAPVQRPSEAAPLWQPTARPKKLGGATALVLGIVIGAVIVGLVLAVVLLLRGGAQG